MTDGVVVTGIGVLAAGGRGPDALWEAIAGERDGLVAAAYPGADATALVGRAPDVERRETVRTAVGRRIDRLSLLLLAAARDAIADGGLTDAEVAGASTGIVLGSAFGNFEETASFLDRLGTRGSGNPLVFPNLVMNASLSYLSIELGVTGPTVMVTQQELSGEGAVAVGLDLVESGAVERCLVGAGDELTPELYAVLREVGALGTGRAKVYDERADGCVPGEGAAMLVLERATSARARGRTPWARIAGALEFGVPAPLHGWPRDPAPLAERLRTTARGATFVVGAASGIAALDRVEAAALAAGVPGETPVVAPRATVGHFGSAGILGAVVAAVALRRRTVPPGVGRASPHEGARRLGEGPLPSAAGRSATVVGLARGGACCLLSLEEAPAS